MGKHVNDMYECDFCGQEFEYSDTYKAHKSTCGKRRLQHFDDGNDLNKLDNMNEAVRRNDYDKKPVKKSRQKSINSY